MLSCGTATSPRGSIETKLHSIEEAAMALQEKLDAMREMSKTRVPPEARAVMERSVADLRASGIMTRVAKVGQAAPDFTLPNADGRPVGLKELLTRGPVVLSFYRGRW
jgi:CRISPR/Cas system-associated exonuclease Cas4 (RecB family)